MGPFLLTFAIAMIFLIMQFLWKYVDDLMGKGLEWYVIAELLFYASANLVPMALPLAILLSSIMLFGNLGESSELTAMKSSGLSLLRIMRPLTIFIFLLSFAAFLFANYLWPVANMKFRSLIFDIQQQKPSLSLNEKSFYNDIPGYSIRIMEKNKKGDEFKDVLIFDHSEGNVVYKRDIWAEGGSIEQINGGKAMIFHLTNGKIYQEVQPRMVKGGVYPYQKIYFKRANLNFDLSAFQLQRTNVDVYNTHYEMLNMEQLATQEDSLKVEMRRKKEELARNIERRYLLFRKAGSAQDPEIVATGSIIPVLKPNSVDTNLLAATPSKPILQSFEARSREDKKRIVDGALNMARGNVDYLIGRRDEFNGRDEFIQRHRLEWHRKLTLSVACIILFFIGAPLGAIIRKGGLGAPIVASTLLFILYYIISITGEKMAKSGVIDPFWGMWISSIILFPVGFFLTYKSNRDSTLFDLDFYLRILGLKRLKKPKFAANENSSTLQ